PMRVIDTKAIILSAHLVDACAEVVQSGRFAAVVLLQLRRVEDGITPRLPHRVRPARGGAHHVVSQKERLRSPYVQGREPYLKIAIEPEPKGGEVRTKLSVRLMR